MKFIDREHQAAQYIIEDLAAMVEKEKKLEIIKAAFVKNYGEHELNK